MKYIVLSLLISGILATPVEDEALQEFVIGNRKFSAAVYKELLSSGKDNFIASPFSAETVLALTNEGANGDTARELVTGLSLPSTTEKTQKAFRTFLPDLKKSEETLKLLSANKIYVGKGVELEDNFKSTATNIYKSGIENIDFQKNTEAASAINNWVEDNTNSKIRNLIKPSDITSATKMVLVNALYFSGQWVNPFEPFATTKKQFFKSKTNPIEVDTMFQVDDFNYYENPTINAKFLSLPYKGSAISMVIVLPNEIEGLAKLEQNIEQVLAPQPLSRERVQVLLPKFTIESEIKFVPILKNLGIRKIFSQDADLSGLSSTDKGLYVSDVIQKAFINVTESGTEAAAATSAELCPRSCPPEARPEDLMFHVNQPFIFYIVEKSLLLFTGRISSL